MKKVSQKIICHTGAVQIQIKPPPIPLMKMKIDLKMERDYVKKFNCTGILLQKNCTYMNLK